MQAFFSQLLNWSKTNDMTVNFTKTKEMVMGPLALCSNLPQIQWADGHIERVSSFKLLGLHLDAYFSWHSHVEAVTSDYYEKAGRHAVTDRRLREAPRDTSSLTQSTRPLFTASCRAVSFSCPGTSIIAPLSSNSVATATNPRLHASCCSSPWQHTQVTKTSNLI